MLRSVGKKRGKSSITSKNVFKDSHSFFRISLVTAKLKFLNSRGRERWISSEMPNQYAVCAFNMLYMYPLWSQCGVKEVSVTQRKKYKCWLDNGHPAELNTSSVTHNEPLSIIRGSTSFELVVFNELAIFFSSNETMVFWNILLAEIWLVFRVFAPFIRKRQSAHRTS